MNKLFYIPALILLVMLIGCPGGGGDSSSQNGETLPVEPLVKSQQTIDAARLLSQASFGASKVGMLDVLQYSSLEAWIDAQMALPQSYILPIVMESGNSSSRGTRHYAWWENAVNAPDQLRQRVAFALSEILVVSDVDYTLGNSQYGLASYYDMLGEMAFGNFRELLERVTLHPVMGVYLSMVRNEQADVERNIRPDENYAREVMQLFTIGLYELDSGGNPTPANNPTPAYTQRTVEEYARVFTGWNFADSEEWHSSDLTSYDKVSAMVPQDEYHDSGSKQLLSGVVSPAGLSAREDLAIALDSLFNHPNVGPFISKQLIKKMVTSNPSSAYVSRVSAVFNNNGSGVRGDLGAVVKAILLDDEARNSQSQSADFGKLKEPLLRATHFLRVLEALPGTTANGNYHMATRLSNDIASLYGQAVLSSPSVFNFFSPDTPASVASTSSDGNALKAPELQILTEALVAATNNDYHSLIYYSNNHSGDTGTSTVLNIDTPMSLLRQGSVVYLDYLDLLVFSGTMSDTMRTTLLGYITEFADSATTTTETDENEVSVPLSLDDKLASIDLSQLQIIVMDTLFLTTSSPDFLVQR